MEQQDVRQQETYQVQLAIYDLSNGMARNLSAQFLGPQHAIDVIPHTGILVFGREYYFGGNGIESSDPHHFRRTRGLNPIQVQSLGETSVGRVQFEAWCQNHSSFGGLYSNRSYDLFERNCNNFSQHAVTDGLALRGVNVPGWILEVPRRVLASPMGMLIRPIMESMQIQGPSGDDNGEQGNSHSFGFAQNHNANTSSGGSASDSRNYDAASTAENPWASMPSTNTSTSTSADANSTKCPSTNMSEDRVGASSPAPPKRTAATEEGIRSSEDRHVEEVKKQRVSTVEDKAVMSAGISSNKGADANNTNTNINTKHNPWADLHSSGENDIHNSTNRHSATNSRSQSTSQTSTTTSTLASLPTKSQEEKDRITRVLSFLYRMQQQN